MKGTPIRLSPLFLSFCIVVSLIAYRREAVGGRFIPATKPHQVFMVENVRIPQISQREKKLPAIGNSHQFGGLQVEGMRIVFPLSDNASLRHRRSRLFTWVYRVRGSRSLGDAGSLEQFREYGWRSSHVYEFATEFIGTLGKTN